MMQVKEKIETIEEKNQNDWSKNPNLLEQKSETAGAKKRNYWSKKEGGELDAPPPKHG